MHPANGDLILKEESWPGDARWILTEFQMSEEGAQRGNRTPRFILAQDKKIIFTTTGNRTLALTSEGEHPPRVGAITIYRLGSAHETISKQ